MKTSNENRWAFKVLAGSYLSEDDLEALGISADWHLYLSPTEPPSAAQCNQQMNAYDLIACPCCGGRATIIGTLKTCEWSVICTMCGLETAHMMQPKDAALAWNRRHAPDEEGAALKSQGDVVSTKPRDGEAKQPEAQAVARLVIVDRGGGFKAIRKWDDIGDLPPGEHFLFSATHPTPQAGAVTEACHRDTCTKEQWGALVAGMPHAVTQKAANWLAHGAHCFRVIEGIACTRADWMREGTWRLLTPDGSDHVCQLPVQPTAALDQEKGR